MSSDDATIQKYSQIISQKYNDFTQAWGVSLQYKRDTVTVSKISVPGMDWTMILIVPVEEYVSTLEQHNELTVTLLFSIIFLVVLLVQSYVAERAMIRSRKQIDSVQTESCQEDHTKEGKTVLRMQDLLRKYYGDVSHKVLSKTAGTYLVHAYRGLDVYGLIQIESLNKGSWLVYLFLHGSSWYWTLFVNMNLIGLVLFEFWEWRCDGNEAAELLQNGSMTNDSSMDRQLWLGFHFCVLIIITFDLLVQSAFKLLRHLGNKSIWRELLITSSVYVLVWITFILREYCIAEHACGYAKPLLLFLKWRSLQTTLKMFGKSIANSFAVFMLLALCISMTALAVLIVFRGQFVGDNTLNGFLESLVEMFVFMTSGENYVELVGQARSING